MVMINNIFISTLGVFEPQDLHIKMTVCPRHRELFGTRWRCNRSRCTVPDRVAVHKGTPKAQCGLKKMISAYILRATKVLVPLGSRKYFFLLNIIILDNVKAALSWPLRHGYYF